MKLTADRKEYMKQWLFMDRQRNPLKYRRYKLTYREKHPEKYLEENKKRSKQKAASEALNVIMGFCKNHFGRPFAATSTRLCEECLEKRREIMNTRYAYGVSLEVLEIFRQKARLPYGARLAKSFIDEKTENRSFRVFNTGLPKLLFDGRIYAREGQLVDAGKMIMDGKSSKSIAREVMISENTVSKFRRILVDECGAKPKNCACGREASHWGRCDQGKGRRRIKDNELQEAA